MDTLVYRVGTKNIQLNMKSDSNIIKVSLQIQWKNIRK